MQIDGMALRTGGDVDPRLPGLVPRRDAQVAGDLVGRYPVAGAGGEMPALHQPQILEDLFLEREAGLGDGCLLGHVHQCADDLVQ
jgi:hypothetical protein